MDLARAQQILGVGAGATDAELRTAYRRLLREHHPDVAGDQTDRDAREIIEAYRVVRGLAGPAPAAPSPSPSPAPSSPPAPRPAAPRPGGRAGGRGAPGTRRWGMPRWSAGSPPPAPGAGRVRGWKPPAWLSSPDTLSLAAPADEALPYLLDLAHRFGEVTYLDAESGLFETVIKTTTGATQSLVVTLQGRGLGSTEAFFTIETLHAPPGAALVTAHDVAAAFAEELNRKTP